MPATKDGRSTGSLGGDVSGGTPIANETELLAWKVLRAANQQQAKGSTVRLVVPSAPEVAHEMGMDLSEARLLEVEEHLKDHGYIEPVDIGLTRGTYTISPAGLEYLDVRASEPLQTPREEATELSEKAEPRVATARLAARGNREGTEKHQQGWIPRRFQLELLEARKQLEERSEERGWWRRMFGG